MSDYMVETVARAISKADVGQVAYVTLAKAAIAAMSAPTDAMLEAGLAELKTQLGDTAVIIRDPLACWRAMTHAALAAPSLPEGQ